MYLFFTSFGFVFVALFATVTNYILELFPYNKVTSFFIPKTEGIWNKISVTILPIILWSFIESPVLASKSTFVLATFLNIFVSCSVIYVIKYGAFVLFNKEGNTVNILAIFVSSFIGSLLSYMLFFISTNGTNAIFALGCLAVLLVCYIIVTLFPPETKFFGFVKEETKKI